jgi:hypothetical protein
MPCGHLSAERPAAPACWPASVSSASWTPTTKATRLISWKQSSVPHQLLLPARQSIKKLFHKNVSPFYFKIFSLTDGTLKRKEKNVVSFSYFPLSQWLNCLFVFSNSDIGRDFRCKNQMMNCKSLLCNQSGGN